MDRGRTLTTDLLRVSINGKEHRLRPGGSILDGLRAVGIHVPMLCHDERLVATGACRLCLVRVKGLLRPVAACATPLTDGMAIETDTADLREARRGLLSLLSARYPADAVARWPEKPFHRLLSELGLERDLDGHHDPALQDRSHPYVTVDMARCIDCYRCVRICDELQGQRVWHIRDRGLETRIEPDGPTLRESSCVACGACVDTCPTGALEDAAASPLTSAAHWTRTTCPYCGVGCELDVGAREARIVSVRPVLDAPVSKGHLCVKGRYAFDYVAADDRATAPMIREGATWRRTSWNDARAFVSQRLRAVIDRHGPDSIGMLGSARATNEDNFLAQKFARAVIGTNNVDCCARVCHAPSAAGLRVVLGAGLATNSFDDIELARTILICGANPTEGHPIVGARIRQAARKGARLIVIDPRRIELVDDAAHHLAIRPGTNVALLNAFAHVIVGEHLHNREFVQRRVSGFEDFRAFIDAWPPERAAVICGVEAAAIREAARAYATGPPAMSVHGLGLTEHVRGTDGVKALVNLALLTGNIGKRGAGINPLRGQNNVQGAAHMGCDPGMLAGSVPIDEGREACERLWGVSLSRARGLNLLEMIDAAGAGRLKGLWSIGYDILLTNPNASETARALRSLDLVIVQDLFLTETAREFGSVFLPACSSFEKEGTFMNAERRIQRVRAALRPTGLSKPDWKIISEVARAMGARGFEHRTSEEIWDEIRALCPGARGMTYARLDAGGLQWPCPAENHPGTAILHQETFAAGPRAMLQRVDHRPTPEHTTEACPLLLNTGRSLYQFNAGTMTGRTPNVLLRPEDVLDISPVDALALGLQDGDRVRVVSRYGSAVMPAHFSSAVATGQLFATFHTAKAFVNALTGPNRDSVVGTPEYKVTAVRIEIPDEAEASTTNEARAPVPHHARGMSVAPRRLKGLGCRIPGREDGMRFINRADAGRQLAARLMEYANRSDVIVLALPRGGVPVAHEVAARLKAPLDVFLVRKLGVPGHPELAMGAIAAGGIAVLSESLIQQLGVPRALVDQVAARERLELERRDAAYRAGRRPPVVRDRTVILVDDGLATGSTMEAAILALRQQAPARIVVAAPVGARETCERLGRLADRVVCVSTPDPFDAVGLWYEDFSQTTDEEVRRLLAPTIDPPRSASRTGDAVAVVRDRAVPVKGDPSQYDALLEAIGDARVVLLGEATHGTHEFYRERAFITRRLIVEKGFNAVAVEADWPDAYRVNRYVRGAGVDEEAVDALGGFGRFPTWMWRNADVLDFAGWLRAYNEKLAPDARAGFYGLDLYSLRASMDAVLTYLDKIDPDGARRARRRYGCFDQFGQDGQEYGYATSLGLHPSCEQEAVTQLLELHRRRMEYASRDGRVAADEFFYVEQNARLVRNAEQYYRAMFGRRVECWNLRDRHMAETLRELIAFLDRTAPGTRVVVWAHNSHLGDARATEMGSVGELNVGQLARDEYGSGAVLVGFTTYTGTVTAATEWDGPARRRHVRPTLPGSYERLFHDAQIPRFLLRLRTDLDLASALTTPRLERAIGVLYIPETERASHYFHARLPEQFDYVLHFDETRAVEPLERTALWARGEVAETFPTGL